MLYLVDFLILNSFLWICRSEIWENFVDRLDFLVKDSFLIVQCNDEEIQIVSSFQTFEEFQSNFQCTNENEIFEHGINRIQIVDFDQVSYQCENHDQIIRFQGYFTRRKVSLDKEENGVEWPFVHTTFTKEIIKSDPYQMNFFENEQMKMIFIDLKIEDLPKKKENLSIYLEFVNRPMICRIRFIHLQKKNNDDQQCNTKVFDNIYEPVCFYKVSLFIELSNEEQKE